MTVTLKILIVDDELNIRRTLALALEAEGHVISSAAQASDALRENQSTPFDLCFLDMRLGTENGLDLLPKLLSQNPQLKIVVITAHGSIDNAVQAMKIGAFDYVEKPFTSAQIFAVTRKVQTIVALEDKVRQLEEELGTKPGFDLSSQSPAMKRVIDTARNAALADVTILITGENGTGKSGLAKVIHGWSPRAPKPFAVVSCPSLSAELLESELFGHSKGAFTGAVKSNPGRIAACEGGTLFLDEIGDMPLVLQAKLLRFLQDREYEPVGDTVTRKADVRILAATNVNLAEAVKAGRFREDLFYRLNVIPLAMPALRERKDDIERLSVGFLASLRRGKSISGFAASALESLKTYDWPGNIRELRNVIERAVILSQKNQIEARDLNLDEGVHPVSGGDSATLVTLEELEEKHIRKVLGATRSMEAAAQTLGIDTVTLWRKRKRYGL